jgi:hypothetical protein
MNSYKSEKLPRELKQFLPEAYKENEQAYWLKREILIQQFANKWVAIHDGKVVAVAEDMTGVMDEVGKRGLCDAYIEKVGGEYDTVFTIRRRRGVRFAYDSSYFPPIPRAEVTFSNFQQTHRATYDNVIPDTGADSTVLPLNDCASFTLFSSPFYSSLSRGIDSAPAPTLIYRAFAEITRHTYSALIEAHPFYSERLLGREVMNALVAIFDGPRGMMRFQF